MTAVMTFDGKLHKRIDRNGRKRKIVQHVAGDVQNLAGRGDFIDEVLAVVV